MIFYILIFITFLIITGIVIGTDKLGITADQIPILESEKLESSSRQVDSKIQRISIIFEGEYESAWAAGGFEASFSGKKIYVGFEWPKLKVYSGNKEIKRDKFYLDEYLRKRLIKGKKIEIAGKFEQVKNDLIFAAYKIYLPADSK
jgi:hypothetical protein